MTRQTAFPDFDNGAEFDSILETLAPYGFADSSWKNDVCPSIAAELNPDRDESRVVIWADYLDPDSREIGPDSGLFFVCQYDPDGTPIDATGQGFARPGPAAAYAAYLTGQTPPLALDGFRVHGTGGNCDSLLRENPDGTHWLVTGEDANRPQWGESVVAGLYDSESGHVVTGDDSDGAEFGFGQFPPALFLAEIGRAETPREAFDVLRIALAFAGRIRAALSESELGEVIRRNRESGTGCATHDFLDANMPMAAAFESVMGRDILPDDGPPAESDCELWNRAWDFARESEFFA